MQYADSDPVVLWVNKVGPYNNPQETYNYYSLPFCMPGKGPNARHKWGGLGEVLEGNELIDSEIVVKYRGSPICSMICILPLIILQTSKELQYKVCSLIEVTCVDV